MTGQDLPHPKRFITENNDEGKAVFSTQIPEELPARVIECGDKFFLGYTTSERPVDINGTKDIDTYRQYQKDEPGIVIPGGTVLRFVDIRPGGVSPMHRTVSLDYGVVVEGEVIIRLDSGESRLMRRGDVTIQRGTMHEWENASKTEWARMIDSESMNSFVDSEPGRNHEPDHDHDHESDHDRELDHDSEQDHGLDTNPPCPWRTTRFHDQECSLFFDCPSHIVERSLSAAGSIYDASVHEASGHEGHVHNDDRATIIDSASTDSNNGVGDGNDQTNALPALPSTPAHDESVASSRSAEPTRPGPSNIHPDQTEGRTRSGGEAERGLPTLPEPRRERTPVSRERMDAPLPSPHRTSASTLPPLPPPPPPPPHSEVEGSISSEWSVPRWQPDAEVTYCPICRAQFSFFVRKHHCRIIIPHQYIVRPPGSDVGIPQSLLIDGLAAGYFDVHNMAGGVRVRLCNPCVPDPNTAPPQSPGTPGVTSPRSAHQRSRSSAAGQYGTLPASNRHGAIFAPGTTADAYQYLASRSRSITVGTQGSSSTHGSSSRRVRSGTHQTPVERLLSGGSSSSYPNRHSMRNEASSSHQRALPPTPQIAEEDECPICHRELPSQSLPNSEALRESHITTCIQTHSTYGTPRSGDDASAPPAAPRQTGMYSYLATEKDCIDDAECTICLEEFSVGIPMARLECLCRFHRSCISAWFVNHPGRCPVHQHDGFGY
ncbi:hypothetical protein EDB81DRAFT_837344 [Dactylonectria macrodidyma]|uniref:RING-type domain-containing protein n=1 Tax=Dactylonectria macrodidyma TaxID=307937 RepID=A0A9P9JL77_9HYPO|nr:hypothetical protein EDB81DRAFT_837344 [Dactylonectria macrodidyma]